MNKKESCRCDDGDDEDDNEDAQGVELSIDHPQLGRSSSVMHFPIEASLDQLTCGWIDDNTK